MAHHRQELVLRTVRYFRPLFFEPQRFFGCFLGGDISQIADENSTVATGRGIDGEFRRKIGPISAHPFNLYPLAEDRAFSGFQVFFEAGIMGVPEFGGHQQGMHLLADDISTGVTKGFLGPRVEFDHPAIRINHDNTVERGIDRLAKLLFALSQGFFPVFELGDIGTRADRETIGRYPFSDPDPLAVGKFLLGNAAWVTVSTQAFFDPFLFATDRVEILTAFDAFADNFLE